MHTRSVPRNPFLHGILHGVPILTLLLGQSKAEYQIAASPASVTTARRHCYEFVAVDHVHRGRRKDAGTRIEFPEQVARLRVIGKEVAGNVAAASDEDDTTGGRN
jgi:hypothetical protein